MEHKRAIPTNTREDRGESRTPLFSDVEIEDAKRRMTRAFELSGLVDHHGHPICPRCGKGGKQKVKIRDNGSWTCMRGCGGSGNEAAIWFLAERMGVTEVKGRAFLELVGLLLDRPLPPRASSTEMKPIALEPTVRLLAVEEFHAVVDTEVYETVMKAGDVRGAQEYYGRWHINPNVVIESRAVMLTDIEKLRKELLARFGEERLIASGILRGADEDRDAFWMISEDYPVIEPHCRPDGTVVGMQFRPSYKREARYRKHVAYKKHRDAAEAAGETFREPRADEKYVPKFLSLRGGVPGEHLVGCGLPRLMKIDPGSDVCVVEGFKDYLAMRTLGMEAYAIPGAKALPAERVCRVLKRHTMVLCLDADEAGEAGIEALEAHFGELDVPNRRSRRTFPQGWDVTDYLVSRNAEAGCTCNVCSEFRRDHPQP
jgi:5S rRNA maturation endonuclease (ribonuclease M5)